MPAEKRKLCAKHSFYLYQARARGGFLLAQVWSPDLLDQQLSSLSDVRELNLTMRTFQHCQYVFFLLRRVPSGHCCAWVASVSNCSLLCLVEAEAFPVRLLPRLGISFVTPDSGPVTGGLLCGPFIGYSDRFRSSFELFRSSSIEATWANIYALARFTNSGHTCHSKSVDTLRHSQSGNSNSLLAGTLIAVVGNGFTQQGRLQGSQKIRLTLDRLPRNLQVDSGWFRLMLFVVSSFSVALV